MTPSNQTARIFVDGVEIVPLNVALPALTQPQPLAQSVPEPVEINMTLTMGWVDHWRLMAMLAPPR